MPEQVSLRVKVDAATCIKGTTDGGNANTIECSPGFSR